MIEDKELLELQNIINEKKKHTLLDKIFESKKIDTLLKKFNISIIKYTKNYLLN